MKRTVSVISRDPPGKDSNARFLTVPLKPLSVQISGRYRRFSDWKSVYFCEFLIFLIIVRSAQVTFAM